MSLLNGTRKRRNIKPRSGGAGKAIFIQTTNRRSRILHNTPAAAFPLPRIRRAPSLLFSENLSRDPANTSFTNPLLPITAPSVKYRTRQRNILAKTTPPILRRILHHPCPHRIQIDISKPAASGASCCVAKRRWISNGRWCPPVTTQRDSSTSQ